MSDMTENEFMQMARERQDASIQNASQFYLRSGGGYGDPNKESRTRDISERFNVPMEVARNYYDKFRQEEAAQKLKSSPALAEYLSDPNNKIGSRDKLDQVTMPERIWNLLQALPRAGIAGVAEGTVGTAANAANVMVQSMPTYAFLQNMADNPQAMTAEEFDKQLRIAQEAGKQNADDLRLTELSKNIKEATDIIAGENKGFGVVERGLVSGVRSIGSVAAGMGLSMVTGNPVAGLAMGGALEGFGAASDDLNEGRDLGTALTHGWINGLTEVATELIPMSRLIKDVAGKEKYSRMVVKNWLRETPTELVATTIQNFTDIAAKYSNGDIGGTIEGLLSGGEGQQELLNEYKQQYLGSLLETGISIIPMTLLSAGMARAAQRRSAMTVNNVLKVINKEAQESELNEVDAEAYRILNQTVINRTDENGNPVNPDIKNVRIDYDAWVNYFTEREMDPEKAADDFGITNFVEARKKAAEIKANAEKYGIKNIEDAQKGGVKLVMSLDMYSSHFAKAGHGTALLNDTTLGTELTPNELRRNDYIQRAKLNQRIEDYVKSIEENIDLNDALEESIDFAHGIVMNDLKQKEGLNASEYEAQAKVNARMRTVLLFQNRVERAKEMGHELSNNELKRQVRRDIQRYQAGVDIIDQAIDDIRLGQEADEATMFTKSVRDTAPMYGEELTEDDERIVYESGRREQARAERALSDRIKADIEAKGLDVNAMSNDEIRNALGEEYGRRTDSEGISEEGETYWQQSEEVDGPVENTEINEEETRKIPLYQEESFGNGEALKAYKEANPDKVAKIEELKKAVSLEENKKFAVQNQAPSQMVFQERLNDKVSALAKEAGINLLDMEDPVTADFMVEVAAADTISALEHTPSAVGWYDEKVRLAIGYAGLLFPELNRRNKKTFDPDAQFAFIYALAVTSNGLKVNKNLPIAVDAYEEYRRTGKFKEVGVGQAAKAINGSLAAFPDFIAKFRSLSDMRKFFMTQWTVRQIGMMFDNIANDELKDETTRGALIIGPKIGNGFLSNMYGMFEALTMDRWFMRTVGRFNGGLIRYDQMLISQHLNRLINEVSRLRGNEELAKAIKEGVGFDMSYDGDVEGLYKMAAKASDNYMDKEVRERLFADFGNDADELRKAINALGKDFTDPEHIAPANGTERAYLRAIFGEALSKIKSENPGKYDNLSMADMQALLWYAEKQLYASTKEGASELEDYNDEDAPDYATVMEKVARDRGIEDKQIKTIQRQVKNDIKNSNGEKWFETFSDGEKARTFGEITFESIRQNIQSGEKNSRAGVYVEARTRPTQVSSRSKSRTDSGRSGTDGQQSGLLRYPKKDIGGVKLPVVAEFRPGSKIKAVLQQMSIIRNGTSSTAGSNVFELQPTPEAIEHFRSATIKYGKDLSVNEHGACVDLQSAEDLADCRIFMTPDGKAGFALKYGDDIVNVFAAPESGAGHTLIEVAKAAGGRRLDCFGTVLHHIYGMHGFVPVAKTKFNPDYAPEDWDYKTYEKFNKGMPDVIHMALSEMTARNTAWMDGYIKKELKYVPYEKGAVAQQEFLSDPDVIESNSKADELYKQPEKNQSKDKKLNQSSDGTKRGYTRIRKDAKMDITLLKDADFSTYSHETAHYMLESMKNMIADGDASQAMINEFNRIMEFVGNTGEEITTEQHEKFAEAFEKYLMEGEAPSPELKGPFQRFKKWLTDIYKNMMSLDVELSDDIREVFDRMLAADEEIERMREIDDIRSILEEAGELGLTHEEKSTYTRLLNKELEEAKDKLRKRLMRDKLKERTKEYKDALKKARESAKAEYESHPVIEAIRQFNGATRLNRKNLIDTYGEEILKQLPKNSGKNIFVDNGEVTVSDMAQELGISQEEMIDTLKALKNKGEWIEKRAKEMLKENNQEMMTPKELEEEVEMALNNDEKETRLKAELSVLRRANKAGMRKQAQQKKIDAQKQKTKEAKEQADWDVAQERLVGEMEVAREKEKQRARDEARREGKEIEKEINSHAEAMKSASVFMISDKNSKELRPQDYLNAMRSTSRKIKELLMQKDPDYRQAARLKEQELMSYYLYREAQKAQAKLRKGIDNAKRIRRIGMDKALKNRTAEYVYKAKYIAGVLMNSPDSKMLERIRKEEEYKGGENKWNYVSPPLTELSVGQALTALNDVTEYWSQALADKTIEVNGKRIEIAEAADELANGLAGRTSMRVRIHKPGFKNKIKRAISNFIANTYVDMVRMEAWCDAVDSGRVGKETGPWMKYIFNPIKTASDLARDQQEKVIADLSSIYEEFKFTEGTINADEIGFTFGESTGYGKAELIHALLHMGNESNLERLINGHKWGDFPVVPGRTNTTKWQIQLAKFIENGTITEADMDRVQRIWDLFESLKPQSQKAYKAVFGRYFDEIPARSFKMFGKEYKGGYVPVIYDPNFSNTGSKQEHTAEDLFNGVRDAMPKMKAGWGESRVDTTGMRLLFDLSRLRNHLQKQVLFAYMGPAAMDVEKMLNRSNVQEALNQYDTEWLDQVIKPWLNRAIMQNVSMGEMRTATDKVFSTIRSRSGCAIMFGNWLNAVEGFFDLTAAFAVVKGKHMRSAFANMCTNRKDTMAFAMENSVYMRNRLQAEANNANSRLEQALNPSKLRKIDQWAMDHAYFLQGMVDGFTAPVVWTAAYNQATEGGIDHKEAVAQADKTVRGVFGSTNPEDIAKWEGGSAFRRMFTQFTGYFVNRLNLNISETNKIVADSEMSTANKAASITMLFMKTIMLPAWIGAMIRKWAGGSDKDESWAAWLADVLGWSAVEYALSMGGYVGQGANFVAGTVKSMTGNKQPQGRVFYPPALKLFGDIGMNTYRVYGAWKKGENVTEKVIGFGANMNNMVPILPVIPNRLTGAASYLSKVKSGKVKPTGAGDLVRGIATGRASPDSQK